MSDNIFEQGNLGQTAAEERAVLTVRNFMTRSEKYRAPFLELALKARELYETWRPSSRSIIQRANLKLPFGFSIIETEVPQLVDMFLHDRHIMAVEGWEEADWPYEGVLSDFLNQQLEDMRFRPKFPAYIKNMLLDGTAVAKVSYRYTEKLKTTRVHLQNPQTGEIKEVRVDRPEVDYDGPDFEVLQLCDFYPDWSVTVPGDVQAMRGCAHAKWTTLTALKEKRVADGSRVYKNLDVLERSISAKGSDAWSKPYFMSEDFKMKFEQQQDVEPEGSKKAGDIEIWEYWGLYDPKGDGNYKEYVLTIANGDVVIREMANPYDCKLKPFVMTPNIIRDHELYGIPELLAVKALIKEATVLRNSRLDAVNLSVNPMWLVDRAGGINTKKLYARAGGIVLTNDMNALKNISVPDPSSTSGVEVQGLTQDIQAATSYMGSAPTLSQLGSTYGRSATGVNFIQSFAGQRMGLKGIMLSETCFKPMGRLMLGFNAQYVTDEQWVRALDASQENPFSSLSPDTFKRGFDFVVEPRHDAGGPAGEFQKMQAIAQVLMAAENSQPGTVRFDVLLESMLRPLLNNRIKKFVRSDEERQVMQAQQLAATQAVNVAQGQGAPQPNFPGMPPTQEQ